MKPAGAAASKLVMLRLDPSILPDPDKPERGDAYGPTPSQHELVVAAVTGDRAVVYALAGALHTCEFRGNFAYVIASLGLLPTGRMTQELLPTMPTSGTAEPPMSPAELADGGAHEDRCRVLARAIGCSTASLSAFELGERPGDPQPLGTAAMDRSRQSCGGVLTYETMAGAFRVHKGGVYKWRCPKCGGEGTNDGTARICDYPPADPTALDPATEADALAASLKEAAALRTADDGVIEYLREANGRVTERVLELERENLDLRRKLAGSEGALDPATETARDTLVDLLAAAVLDSPKGVASEADIKVALRDALDKPEARAAMREHESQTATAAGGEPVGPITRGLITEALRLIELAVFDSEDEQHVEETLADARKLLSKAIEPAE